MDFNAYSYHKSNNMSRQKYREIQKEEKPEVNKRDAASSNNRFARNDKDPKYSGSPQKHEVSYMTTLNRRCLNDLYERSSI